jgi:hypothetical protein
MMDSYLPTKVYEWWSVLGHELIYPCMLIICKLRVKFLFMCYRLILVGGCSGLLEQMNKHGVKPNIKTFTQLLDTIPSTRAAEQVYRCLCIILHIS